MKKIFTMIFIITLMLLNNAIAADIAGTWEGKLVTGPGTELTVQFIIKQGDDGTLTAVLNSPDQGALKNIPTDSVNLDGNTIKIEISAVEGSFEGSMKDNVIDGKWSQAGMSFPLSLSPYVKPKISREAVEKFLGTWQGEVTLPPPINALFVSFRFEISEEEDLICYADAPEVGTSNLKVNNIEIKGNDLTVTFSQGAAYKGQLSENEISGLYSGPGGQSFPFSLKKGKRDIPVRILNIPPESQDLLLGKWHGTVTLPQISLIVLFRFEKTKKGDVIGFLDMPTQGLSGVMISEAELKEGNLTIKLNPLNMFYEGQLSANSIIGTLAQGGRSMDLSLKKGDVPPLKLNLSKASMEQLLGKWQGILNSSQGSFEVALRFEMTDQGDFVGFYDRLDQGRLGYPIDEATFDQGALTLKINSIRAECKGDVSDNKMSIQFTVAGRTADAELEKIQ